MRNSIQRATSQLLASSRAISRPQTNARLCTSCRAALEQNRLQQPAARLTKPTIPHRAASSATASQSSNNQTETIRTHPQTHYDFFPQSIPHGPPPQGPFSLDLSALRREFLQLQASAHPDRHSGADEKTRAEALSARINEAYRTLRDPLARAGYVLSLQGIDVEDESAKVEDESLLAEVMEAREEIEDAEEASDLDGVRNWNNERVDASVAELEKMFAQGDWEGAKREAVRLRYWMNIRQSVEEWEPGKPIVLIH